MIFSSLKNRLRSCTRVASFKFQNALDLKNRLRCLSHVTKIRVSWNHDTFKFEASAPLSCTCHKFQVSECVGFEESAPLFESRCKNTGFVNSWFFQVWRIGSVLVHVSQRSSFRMRWIWRIGSVLVHVNPTHIGIYNGNTLKNYVKNATTTKQLIWTYT